MSQQPPGPPPSQTPGQPSETPGQPTPPPPSPPAQHPPGGPPSPVYGTGGSPTGGVIGEAWDVYKNNLTHLVPIAFIIYLITSLVTLLLVEVAGFLGAIISILLSIVGVYLVQASLVRAVEDLRDGRADLSIGATMSSVASRLGPVVLASIVAGIAIIIGLVLLIVPGLFLLTIWSLIVPVIVLEGRGAFESFGRSQQLVKGYTMNVFGVLVLAFLVLILFGFVLGLVLSPLPDGVQSFVSNLVSGSLTAPFTACVLTLLYFRLRTAKEGGAGTLPPTGTPPM